MNYYLENSVHIDERIYELLENLFTWKKKIFYSLNIIKYFFAINE